MRRSWESGTGASSITRTTAVGRDETLSGRTALWSAVIERIGARPWLGYGYDAFWVRSSAEGGPAVELAEQIGWLARHAHNGFLDVAVDLGMIGLALLTVPLLACATRVFRDLRSGVRELERAWPGLFLVYWILSNLTESPLVRHDHLGWALYVSVFVSAGPSDQHRADDERRRRVALDARGGVGEACRVPGSHVRIAATAATGLLLVGVAGVLLRGSPPPPASDAGTQDTPPMSLPVPADLGALHRGLAGERAAREALSVELAELREAIRALERKLAPPQDAEGEVRETGGAPGDPPWFDDAALTDLGLRDAEVEPLRRRFAEQEMAELFLRDRAMREGWNRQPRYRSELDALRSQLREEIGEEDYDRMLWAAGRSNRVEIASVLAGSPAEGAGVQAGDVILGYGGRRVFEMRGITGATSEGVAGEATELRLWRDGEELRTFVPRGPLGLRLRATRLPPAG